jgi:hypothetical protein
VTDQQVEYLTDSNIRRGQVMTLCGWCRDVGEYIRVNFWVWAWSWITRTWVQCSAQACRWWCLCCNKWLCWIGLIILTVLVAIAYFILQFVSIIVCIICNLVCVLMCIVPGVFGHGPNCMRGCTGDGGGIGLSPRTWPATTTGPASTTGPRNTTGPMQRRAMESVVVSSLDGLRAATRWWRIGITVGGLVVALPGVDGETNRRLQSAVDRRLAECGCGAGKVGLAAALALYAVVISLDGPFLGARGWPQLALVAVVSAVVGALGGKVVGLAVSQVRLRGEIGHALPRRFVGEESSG